MKIVCRCQDVTEEEVVAAIRQGATTIDEIKRLVRAGMGLCQGRSCRRIVAQILARELKKPMAQIYPPTFRPPNRPVPFSLIMAEYERNHTETNKKSTQLTESSDNKNVRSTKSTKEQKK